MRAWLANPGDRRLTRRQLLGQAASGLSLALVPGLLSSCRISQRSSGDLGGRLAISNWPHNIDPTEPGRPGSVDRFEQASGIEVDYSEDINDAQDFYERLRPDLAAGRSIGTDVFVIPYWLADRMRTSGWLEPLELKRIPNAVHLIPALRHPHWDPQGRYSLPWQAGIAGIAYNIKATGRQLHGIDDLFDPEFHGRVAVLREMRDTMGLMLLAEGQDPSHPTLANSRSAFQRLQRSRDRGQIRAFTGNDYIDALHDGRLVACMAWSGDGAQLHQERADLRFCVPASGGIRWVDVMAVPRHPVHPREAARWMNFVYDPVEAARITAHVCSISPVAGVSAILARSPATSALARDPLLFPDAALNKRLHVFGRLKPEEEKAYEERFAEIALM